MLYLDTSALVKLIRPEPETEALTDWLAAQQPTPWVSSKLIEVELPRAIRRTEPSLLVDVPATLARVSRYEVNEAVRAAAAAYPDPMLRSLNAIHLATGHAVFGARLTAFVAYDRQLFEAAQAVGLPAVSPGR
ncbi:type II toxin-antitoxin system VapC family toxin [Mycolicibacter sp. MYC123]|uniref:Ribonuclease VapC n=1 Tax=[Mycobacterium] zoologicum TaxID=2872311 RepID=A0ABU5YKM6_9MYCO|nr:MULTISPECIES: type II toxin-antitoxin system VapC family toxin [unclassified Mycolicibacter]MEB3049298.1 type II toxin-antitoxin system VapC family toxin [Mycolicibacter sp. MYC123]MEB3062598.1 type II toxin-antitoxin system VapC family toxin [Mycolicibacter sp. MYC101]